MKFFNQLIRALLLLLLALPTQALTVLSINTEWFWDAEEPDDGRVAIGPAGNRPSHKQVAMEAYIYASHILRHNADIVGLVEVEGEGAARQIIEFLPEGWTLIFAKGRDTITGQDVAILSRLSVIPDTVTNDFPKAAFGRANNIRPSKGLGVGLRTASGESVYVVAAHLASKRGSSNDDKRAAQAASIAALLQQESSAYDHTIVLGDLNDEQGSETLKQLINSGLYVIADAESYSYIHNNDKQLIDHILVTEKLTENAVFSDFYLGPVSDHRGVKAVLPSLQP